MKCLSNASMVNHLNLAKLKLNAHSHLLKSNNCFIHWTLNQLQLHRTLSLEVLKREYSGELGLWYGYWCSRSSRGQNISCHDNDSKYERFFFHDDVIKWKHFPRYWPLWGGTHWSLVDSPHKVQWHAALMFLWSASEQTIGQTVETPVIWVATADIYENIRDRGFPYKMPVIRKSFPCHDGNPHNVFDQSEQCLHSCECAPTWE